MIKITQKIVLLIFLLSSSIYPVRGIVHSLLAQKIARFCEPNLDKVAAVRALSKVSTTVPAARMLTPDLADCADVPDKDIYKTLAAAYIRFCEPILK